jgi:hypothetical protein
MRDFLADLFSIDVPDASSNDHARIPIRAGATGATTEGTASGNAAPAGGGVVISRISGGFSIKASDPALVGRALRGEVAYRVRAGNPFRKHSPFDFDLMSAEGIAVAADGVGMRPTSVNAFELVPTSTRFQISMKGFDTRRDLVVRVVAAGDAAEAELH